MFQIYCFSKLIAILVSIVIFIPLNVVSIFFYLHLWCSYIYTLWLGQRVPSLIALIERPRQSTSMDQS